MPRLFITTLVVIAFVGMAVEDPAAQFGMTKRKVTLNRKVPPKVYLMNTALRVDGVGQSPQFTQVAQRLATLLEAELTQHDPRLKPVKDAPETIVTATVSRLDNSRTNESRTVPVFKQTGTKQEYNDKKKKYEEKPVFNTVNETHQFVIVKGGSSVAFQVRDAKSGAVLDSDTLSPTYAKEFRDGTGAPDSATVEQLLLQDVVNTVVRRITPTREAIEVMLARPNDQIDDINRLALAGLWSRMSEQLQLTKPFPDKKKEAYRQYNLGVASEAMAYESDDLQISKKLLEEASSYYNRALESNLDEKYFREPQKRIQEGIAAYATLTTQVETYARAIATSREVVATIGSATTPAPAAAPTPAVVAAPAAMTNQDVIDLVAAGLDHANLVDSIKTAPDTNFDLTPAGLKSLLGGKVPNTIIPVMRMRQAGGPPVAPAPARPRTTPAAGTARSAGVAPAGAAVTPGTAKPAASGAAPAKPGTK